MTVKYSIVPKKDPRNPTAPPRYYPSVRNSGRTDLRRIATRISQMCTVNTADTMAVLEAMLTIIPQELADGRIVELGDFGSYRLTVRGSGEADGKVVSAQNILRTRANFAPGKVFRQALATVEYEKESPPRLPAG
jgi:predicted histone-like DNA-binding protein